MPKGTPHKYSKTIENRIRQGIRNGVSIAVILDGLSDLEGQTGNIPKSTDTLYKHYGHAIGEERAKFHEYLGSKARERIEKGSDRILELALRSKAGWNPSVKVEDVTDEEDENKDAISVLAGLLKKETPDEEDE